jgi:hypothetical protein
MGFIQDCFTCFMLGYTGEYSRILNEIEQENTTKKVIIVQAARPSAPHYIIQQVESLTDQIEVNHAMLYRYDKRISEAYDDLKVLDLEKKRHKLAYDTARLEEKRIKLIEKYNLEE